MAVYAHRQKPCTVGDLSAVVTGVLLAYNLPASVPVWMPVIGTLLAIVLVKMIFGGLGSNFVNPALTARAILMTSWVGYMSGSAYQVAVRGVDAVSSATPLVAPESYELYQLFIGQCPGCIGEVGRVALLVGGVYLIVRVCIVKGSFDRLLREGDFRAEVIEDERRMERVGGVYWPIVTAAYLLWSFLSGGWHFTWVIWPAAALVFAAISAVVRRNGD